MNNGPNDLSLQSRTITSQVTVVKIISNFIFAGISNVLHVIHVPTKRNLKLTIPNGHRIHGIHPDRSASKIALTGKREVVLVSVTLHEDDVELAIVGTFTVGDWIWDLKWCRNSNEMTILTATNIVSTWNWTNGNFSKRVLCRNKSLLFCGIILGDEWDDVVVICGTMFRNILIWIPSVATDNTSSVVHNLNEHKGAIFSVFYHVSQRKLCSTSDDRSVRIWQVNFPPDSTTTSWADANITPLLTVYGHMSRVWKCLILHDGRFVSAGEDSQLRVWNLAGEPIGSWETHQGASITSLAVCEQSSIIVTGGKDGGISMWPLPKPHSQSKYCREISFGSDFGRKDSGDVPRRIRVTNSGRILTVTNYGELCVFVDDKWQCIAVDKRFESYCLFELTDDRRYVCLASINGDVKIYEELDESHKLRVIFDKNICGERVYSIQWLSSNEFITCCIDGKLEIWDLFFDPSHRNYNVRRIGIFILPFCKERWLTAAIKMANAVVVGDRDGSIHLLSDHITYKKSECDEQRDENLVAAPAPPKMTFRRVHGRLGVSFIKRYDDFRFCTIGRDGFIRYWKLLSANSMENTAADKLPVKWPVQILQSPSYGLLVSGFKEIDFEVWNIRERRKLLSFRCGGGHRPWDFILNLHAQFVFIKEKTITRFMRSMSELALPPCLDGFHIREIICLRYLTDKLVISGGEDTTLRLSIVSSRTNALKPVAIIRSHISSVRSIDFIESGDFLIVVTAGGRAQLKVWKIKPEEDDDVTYSELASHMLKAPLKCKKPWISMPCTVELEPRHMEVRITRRENGVDTFSIYAAGSDSFWRIYDFDLKTKTLSLTKEIEYAGYCLLKIAAIDWYADCHIVTMSTNGAAVFWRRSNAEEAVETVALHQSGINCYDWTKVGNRLLLVTGGDDAMLRLTAFRFENEWREESCWKDARLHEAQISGVKFVDNFVVSTGADQKIGLWKWTTSSADELTVKVELVSFYRSCIPDIHGLDVNPKQDEVCVYGAGIEIFRMNRNFVKC